MNTKQIEEILVPYLNENGFKLYEINFYKEAGMQILQVLVSKIKDRINVDELAEINNFLSSELDNIDIPYDEYMLEVSSPGAEMVLRNPTEVAEAVGSYIHINSNDQIYEGTMVSFIDDVVTIRVNLKGRFKNFNIPYQSIKLIRLAVKF